MPKADLVAEHAALLAERAELLALVEVEWPAMSYQVALDRGRRLEVIDTRLAAIKRTKTWKGRRVD